jgi:tetratricopeptide (TPR) repeat protein
MKQSYKDMTAEQIVNKEEKNHNIYAYTYWFRLLALAGVLVLLRAYSFSDMITRAVFFILFVINEIIAAVYRKKQKKGFSAVIDDFCDPVKYINILKTDHVMKRNTDNISYICSLSTGLIEAGKYEEAYELLSYKLLAEFAEVNRHGWIYYNNLAVVQLKLNKMEEAESTLEILKQICEEADDGIKGDIENSIAIFQISKLIQEEKFAQANELFENSNFPDRPLRRKVGIDFRRAQIAAGLNDFEKAAEHLNFVIGNGNKLFVVEQAKKLLEKI